MTDCPNCEYHRQRAQRWRDEAYKQAGHPLPEREWVGLTDDELFKIWMGAPAETEDRFAFVNAVISKLKEKNT